MRLQYDVIAEMVRITREPKSRVHHMGPADHLETYDR